jgi:hypothetical protein
MLVAEEEGMRVSIPLLPAGLPNGFVDPSGDRRRVFEDLGPQGWVEPLADSHEDEDSRPGQGQPPKRTNSRASTAISVRRTCSSSLACWRRQSCR